MYSTCDAWIIVKHFYFHVKIPQSDVQQPHWFNIEFLHTLQNGPLWFWFKNTIVPFPKGHESLCPRGSLCPQAQQCAQIDFKTISAQALEKKKTCPASNNGSQTTCVERLRRLYSLHFEDICSIWVTHTVQYQNGKWDKIRETLGATVFPANVVVWSWEFLLCWREKWWRSTNKSAKETMMSERIAITHSLDLRYDDIWYCSLLMFWLQIFKYSLVVRKTLIRLLWQKKK